jgi:predicted RNA methylase
MTGLQKKYFDIYSHIQNVGIGTFIVSKLYDHYIRLRLKLKGVTYNVSAAQNEPAIVASTGKDAHENQPSSFYTLKEGLKCLPITYKEIVLLDIGCGNGMVLNFGMLLKFKQVNGIDLNKTALEKATLNCSKIYQSIKTTEYNVQYADAVEYNIPGAVNVIYLFNPFGSVTMEKVAVNIFDHANKTGKAVYVIYCMPSFKYIFEACAACKKIYERYNKNKTQVELTVFKIEPGQN